MTALILDSRARFGDPNNSRRRIAISMLRNHTGIRKLVWAQKLNIAAETNSIAESLPKLPSWIPNLTSNQSDSHTIDKHKNGITSLTLSLS
jgi:hypothetical protein